MIQLRLLMLKLTLAIIASGAAITLAILEAINNVASF